MKMRTPATVFAGVADAGEGLATGEFVPDPQLCHGFAGEVAVEGEESQAVGGLVFEYDDGAVIEGGLIVGEGLDGGVEGSRDGRTWGGEEIEAKMDGAALRGGILARGKLRSGVKRTRLVVTTDGYGDVGSLQYCSDSLS